MRRPWAVVAAAALAPRGSRRPLRRSRAALVRPGSIRRATVTRSATTSLLAGLRAIARECDFGSFGNAEGTNHALAPCPRSSELGSFTDGDDRPGVVVKRFASPAASLGFHRGRPVKALSTCPAVNKRGCYELDYVVTRVKNAARRAAVR